MRILLPNIKIKQTSGEITDCWVDVSNFNPKSLAVFRNRARLAGEQIKNILNKNIDAK